MSTTLKLKLRTVTVPVSLQHASAKDEIERIPEYIEVIVENLQDARLCVKSYDEPNTDQRDMPWLKTSIDGSPIGWYVFYNGAWTKVPVGP